MSFMLRLWLGAEQATGHYPNQCWHIVNWAIRNKLHWNWNKKHNNILYTLRWRHNERDGVSNHQHHDCLLNHLFRRRSKKTSKVRVTGFCERNSPVSGEFPAQRASNTENVSIWSRHHDANELECVICINTGIFFGITWSVYRYYPTCFVYVYFLMYIYLFGK